MDTLPGKAHRGAREKVKASVRKCQSSTDEVCVVGCINKIIKLCRTCQYTFLTMQGSLSAKSEHLESHFHEKMSSSLFKLY